jgi:tRNA threonylcarbamoyladenosine modification (KEOPS) complex  Pcc1 subunit
MSVGAKAVIRLKFPSQKQLDTLLSALTPETHAMQTKRANVKLKKDGCFLVLSVEADDTVALGLH